MQLSPQFGNSGPNGFGFTLWGSANCREDVHRRSLERLAVAYPEVKISLPPPSDGEDLIEGSLTWDGEPVWAWFETALNHTWLWSANRAALAGLREALLPIAQSA